MTKSSSITWIIKKNNALDKNALLAWNHSWCSLGNCLIFSYVFWLFIGNSDFDPEHQTRFSLMLGGVLMTGWTFLLLWAVRKPIERRVVILITAFPVVFGLFTISLLG